MSSQPPTQNDQTIAQILLTDNHAFEMCVWITNGNSCREYFRAMQFDIYERIRLEGRLALLNKLGLNKEIVEKINTARYAEAIRKIKPKKD